MNQSLYLSVYRSINQSINQSSTNKPQSTKSINNQSISFNPSTIFIILLNQSINQFNKSNQINQINQIQFNHITSHQSPFSPAFASTLAASATRPASTRIACVRTLTGQSRSKSQFIK
jgi:hypothetical protein